MKISNIGAAKGTSRTRRKDKAAGTADSFTDHLRSAEGEAPSAGGVTSSAVGSADTLLAAQATPDSTEGRSRRPAARYGEDLLDRLERLRLDLLDGAVSKDDLTNLARAVRTQSRDSDDPKINEILDEIELRVEVEIAKLTRDR